MGKNGLVDDVPKCSRFANICLNSAVVNFVRFQAWQRAARTVEIRYCHVRTFIQRYCTEMCPENLRSEDGLHLEHIQLFWSSLALLPEIPVWPSEVRSPLYIGSSLGTASRVWCRIQFVSLRNHGVLAGWLETSLAARYLGVMELHEWHDPGTFWHFPFYKVLHIISIIISFISFIYSFDFCMCLTHLLITDDEHSVTRRNCGHHVVLVSGSVGGMSNSSPGSEFVCLRILLGPLT